MTLQSSGQISLSDIGTEFGDTVPHSLSEFYNADEGVPESGELKLSDLYGTRSNLTVVVTEGHNFAFNIDHWGYVLRAPYAFGPPAIGSIDITTFKGETIVMVTQRERQGPFDQEFALDGNHAQTFFDAYILQDGTELLTSATTFFGYDSGQDATLWQWNNTTEISRWDGSGSSYARMYG